MAVRTLSPQKILYFVIDYNIIIFAVNNLAESSFIYKKE